MDPDPDPAIFVIDLQDASKKQIFYTIFDAFIDCSVVIKAQVDLFLLFLLGSEMAETSAAGVYVCSSSRY